MQQGRSFYPVDDAAKADAQDRDYCGPLACPHGRTKTVLRSPQTTRAPRAVRKLRTALRGRGGVGCLEGSVDEKSLRLLKAMREQLGEASASRTVDAVDAANSLGMERGTLGFHRSLHELVRAGYLEGPANPALAPQGTYLITFEGIAAAEDA